MASAIRRRCANCGASARARDRFCSSCGTALDVAVTKPAPVTDSASLQVAGVAPAALGEQRKVVTVLFADLSGSTVLGERLDPEELRGVLASFFNELARQIRRYEGTIDKYIGDAVMAVFGAPLSHEDDAERAINAALAMQQSIVRLNDDLARRHGARLALRIGINTGEVVAGMLAGDVQNAYTVVGDTVNTAQRYESAAPPGEVLVSANTRRLAIHSFEFEETAPLTLKGKAERVVGYRVVRRRYEEIAPEATPFVGRAPEVALLRSAVADAVSGRGRIVDIVGDAGVGKSRLVGEVRAGLVGSIDRLIVRCASFETNTPYALVADIIRGAFSIHAADDELAAREAIVRGFSTLGTEPEGRNVDVLLDVLGYRERSSFAPDTKRQILIASLRRLLAGESARAPLVITAEDLHWADDASVAVLEELSRDVARLPLLLITTSRPGWTPPWRGERLELASLGPDEARELIETVFEVPVDAALSDLILNSAGGNPFFIEEIVRELQASHLLVEKLGRVAIRPDAVVDTPTTVREVLQARLDRLEPGPLRVLQLAAVCGRTFWYRVLERLAPSEKLSSDLAVLEERGFIVARATMPEVTYAFRQTLIQEVAYQTQLQARRRQTHGAVAAAVQELFADRLDEFVDVLAYHYDRGDDDAKALRWLTLAADRAKRLYANDEALRLYRAALRRAPDGDGERQAGTILERIGDVETLIGRYDDARVSLETSGARTPASRVVTQARLLRKIAFALQRKGTYPEALTVLESARATLGAADALESARLLLQVGQVHFWRGEYESARRELESAVRAGEALGADDLVAEGLKLLGNVANNVGDIRGAGDLYRKGLAAYERLEDLVGIADIRSNLGMIYRRMGKWNESLEEYSESLSLRERTGHLRGIAASHNNIGEVYRMRGEPAKAIPHYRDAIDILERTGAAADAAVVLMSLGAAHVDSGDVAAGLADLRAAETQVHAVGRMKYLPDLYQLIATGELARGNLTAAREDAERSIELAREAKARHLEATARRVLAEVALASGDLKGARLSIETSVKTLEELGETAELERSRAVLAKISG